jgi:hypothetical protein
MILTQEVSSHTIPLSNSLLPGEREIQVASFPCEGKEFRIEVLCGSKYSNRKV